MNFLLKTAAAVAAGSSVVACGGSDSTPIATTAPAQFTFGLGAAAVGAGLGLVDDLNYADTLRRGYLVIPVTAANGKGEYVYVNTVKSKTYVASVGKTITVAAPATPGTMGAISYA